MLGAGALSAVVTGRWCLRLRDLLMIGEESGVAAASHRETDVVEDEDDIVVEEEDDDAVLTEHVEESS